MSKGTTKIIYGLYDDDDLMIEGIKSLSKKGVNIHEVYTPFPVHGLDKALKIKKTRLSDLAFVYGLFGTIFACMLTWYTMIRDWPQDIGGKPSYSWYMNMPSFIPIIFELTVFCAAHFMCITYLARCKLFPGASPQNPDPRTTDDKFLVEIHAPLANIEELVNEFKQSGAVEITVKKLAQ